MFAQMTDRPMTMGPATMNPMGATMPGMGMTTMMPSAGNMLMVPRCTMRMEKCPGGMKMYCSCEDEVGCATLQNLCKMLCDGMCSCMCMKNGMCMCQCNMAMCNCTCEMTADGVCITCTSGDKACCDMVQACCDCMMACMEAGCMCCVCFGGTPVCCCTL